MFNLDPIRDNEEIEEIRAKLLIKNDDEEEKPLKKGDTIMIKGAVKIVGKSKPQK